MLRQFHGTNSLRHSDECNRRGHWPYHDHERYVEKVVTLKAAHTTHCELPYGKQKFFQTTHESNDSVR